MKNSTDRKKTKFTGANRGITGGTVYTVNKSFYEIPLNFHQSIMSGGECTIEIGHKSVYIQTKSRRDCEQITSKNSDVMKANPSAYLL